MKWRWMHLAFHVMSSCQIKFGQLKKQCNQLQCVFGGFLCALVRRMISCLLRREKLFPSHFLLKIYRCNLWFSVVVRALCCYQTKFFCTERKFTIFWSLFRGCTHCIPLDYICCFVYLKENKTENVERKRRPREKKQRLKDLFVWQNHGRTRKQKDRIKRRKKSNEKMYV